MMGSRVVNALEVKHGELNRQDAKFTKRMQRSKRSGKNREAHKGFQGSEHLGSETRGREPPRRQARQENAESSRSQKIRELRLDSSLFVSI
jgi:hypothetical protein